MKIDKKYWWQAENVPFWEKIIHFLEELRQKMQDDMENETSTEQLLSLFKNHIVKSAKEVAETETQQKTDWFVQSEHDVLTLISEMKHISFIAKTLQSKMVQDWEKHACLYKNQKEKPNETGRCILHSNVKGMILKSTQKMHGQWSSKRYLEKLQKMTKKIYLS